jgi:hypothetical protein
MSPRLGRFDIVLVGGAIVALNIGPFAVKKTHVCHPVRDIENLGYPCE